SLAPFSSIVPVVKPAFIIMETALLAVFSVICRTILTVFSTLVIIVMPAVIWTIISVFLSHTACCTSAVSLTIILAFIFCFLFLASSPLLPVFLPAFRHVACILRAEYLNKFFLRFFSFCLFSSACSRYIPLLKICSYHLSMGILHCAHVAG